MQRLAQGILIGIIAALGIYSCTQPAVSHCNCDCDSIFDTEQEAWDEDYWENQDPDYFGEDDD